MAVFTPVSLQDLTPWIASFSLGKVHRIEGISSGIENSNFFVNTEKGDYVLTLFEKLSFDELPFYLNLMQHLAGKGIKVAAPVPDGKGRILHTLCGKPACLVTKLEGEWPVSPGPVHCAEVGDMMAKMHLAGSDYPLKQPNLRGIEWWRETVPLVQGYLDSKTSLFLQNEMRFQEAFANSSLYGKLFRGPIHADLFRNNVMFTGEQLSGFFDFYFAGCDVWLFDVAVAVNDWCIDLDTGELDDLRVRAFLDAYHAVRPFTLPECEAWKAVLRGAALRFWLSRLYDYYRPREAKMLTPHDPRHFERILRLRILQSVPELIYG